jgi:hypothetical protein
MEREGERNRTRTRRRRKRTIRGLVSLEEKVYGALGEFLNTLWGGIL